MVDEFDRRRARAARRRREVRMRRRMILTGSILACCLVVGIILFMTLSRRQAVETGSGISRAGLEELLQKAKSVDISAYPSVWTDGLEESIQEVSGMLENQDLTAVEIDSAYRQLLESLQVFSQKSGAEGGEGLT